MGLLLSSAWFFTGSLLIIVLQQLTTVSWSPEASDQLEEARANLAFISVGISAAAVVVCLCLKISEFRKQRKEDRELESDNGPPKVRLTRVVHILPRSVIR